MQPLFGSRVSLYRERMGVHQNVLAERIGLSKSYLNRIEKGQRNPPAVEKVVMIAKVLRLTRDEAEELMQLAGYSPKALDAVNDADPRANRAPAATFNAPFGPDMDEKLEEMEAIATRMLELVAEVRATYPKRG